MKRFAMILCLALCSATLALAQNKPKPDAPKTEAKPAAAPALPTVDQILANYVEGLGGKAALEKHSSRTSKGSFEIPAMGLTGTLQIFEKAPNMSATSIDLAGVGAVNIVFNGKQAWQQDPMTGLREMTGVELATMKIEGEFYGPLKLKELYKTIEVKGKEKVGAAETYLVVATPAEGSPVKLYFDATSGLLVRRESEQESPQGKMPTELLLEDYRVVDGVKLPFVVKTNTPAMAFVIKLEEVKHGVAIDDAKFAKPAGQ
jgi:outer membrane lipoprotein-sorting protein